MRLKLFTASLLASLALAPAAAAEVDTAHPPPGSNDWACVPSAEHPRPVVLVHGLGANDTHNWAYHSPRIKAAGYCVFSLTYGLDERTQAWPYRPGGTIRMQKSSSQLKRFVNHVLELTGAREVDLIGHSEGTVMPRWYLEKRNGADVVKRFIALTPLWRGTNVAEAALLRDLGAPYGMSQPMVKLVASFCGSCPQFVAGSHYLRKLNRDGEAVPGVIHTNIATATDVLVVPYTSGLMLDGGTNIVLQKVCPLDLSDHAMVAFDPVVSRLFLNALDPKDAQPVRC